MDKLDVVNKIKEIGVVSVVRGKTPEEAIMMSEACIKGGVTAIELAFTTPRAHEVIEALSKKYADNPDVIIGAGTVLDAITARIAIHGPLPQAPLMPTGGVNVENAGDWIKAGCVAVGAGGALTGGGKTADEITDTAKKFIAAVQTARK